MRIIYTFLFTVILFAVIPAKAEDSPYKGGMKHSKIYRETQPLAKGEEDAEIKEERKKSRVWNKYKALSTGNEEEIEQAEQQEEKAKLKELEPTQKQIEEHQAAMMEQEQPRAQPNAMSMLLQKYQQNKERRKDLKSLSLPTPDALKEHSKGITETENKE